MQSTGQKGCWATGEVQLQSLVAEGACLAWGWRCSLSGDRYRGGCIPVFAPSCWPVMSDLLLLCRRWRCAARALYRLWLLYRRLCMRRLLLLSGLLRGWSCCGLLMLMLQVLWLTVWRRSAWWRCWSRWYCWSSCCQPLCTPHAKMMRDCWQIFSCRLRMQEILSRCAALRHISVGRPRRQTSYHDPCAAAASHVLQTKQQKRALSHLDQPGEPRNSRGLAACRRRGNMLPLGQVCHVGHDHVCQHLGRQACPCTRLPITNLLLSFT